MFGILRAPKSIEVGLDIFGAVAALGTLGYGISKLTSAPK